MGRASPALTAFIGGEFSPQMEGRVDEEKYAVASHISQNFLSIKQGPATFRQGTAYVAQVKNSANKTWIRRFEFSQTQAFILEFGDQYVRFYTNHGQLLSTGVAAYSNSTAYAIGATVLSAGIQYYCIAPSTGNAPPNASFWYAMAAFNGSATVAIYEIPSPYAAADLTDSLGEFTLQIVQSGDVLYIAGGSAGSGYQPQTLTRFANAPPNWQFAVYSPNDGPFSDPVPLVPGQEIAIGVSGEVGTITITAFGGPLFAATDVGRLVRIQSQTFNQTPWATGQAHSQNDIIVNNGNDYIALSGGTSGGSPPVHTSGAALDGPGGIRWLYTDSGYGVARITAFTDSQHVTATVLLRMPANVVISTATITAITKANPAVVSAVQSMTIGQSVFIVGVLGMTQVNQIPYVNGGTAGTAVSLAGVDSTGFGTYTSGGTIIANATTEWQLGAWSNTTEWPRANAFFKDRLFWGGKLNIWGSVPGLYNSHTPDFFGQQTTDSAMNELVAGNDASNICWLSSAIILLIGTEGGEYGLDAANYSASPLGPANVEILRQSNWRCRHIAPELIGTSVLYAQRAGRKVFAMDYNFYLNRYDSTDQSKFSYHITIGGLTGMAYQQEPWSVLWATRADGTLLSYTFNREDQVTAWARHNLGNNGIAESVAVIPSPDASRDELWMVVNRTVNGAVIRTVEYMVKHYEGPQGGYAGDPQSSAWYVDCGVQSIAITGDAITNVSIGGSPISGQFLEYECVNNFTAGQSVFIAGIVFTGTLNPNMLGAIINDATPTAFSINFGGPGSLNYISGGTASIGGLPSTNTISGLPQVMWNQTVAIFADGGVQPQMVVSGTGTLTLPTLFNTVTIGFPYQGNLCAMRPEGGADIGTAQGKRKQGATTVVRLVDAAGGTVSQLSNQNATTQVYQNPLGLLTQTPVLPEKIFLNYTTTALDSPPPFQSGDFPLSFPHSASSDQDASDYYILIQKTDPTPMTVVGLFPSYKVEEWQ